MQNGLLLLCLLIGVWRHTGAVNLKVIESKFNVTARYYYSVLRELDTTTGKFVGSETTVVSPRCYGGFNDFVWGAKKNLFYTWCWLWRGDNNQEQLGTAPNFLVEVNWATGKVTKNTTHPQFGQGYTGPPPGFAFYNGLLWVVGSVINHASHYTQHILTVDPATFRITPVSSIDGMLSTAPATQAFDRANGILYFSPEVTFPTGYNCIFGLDLNHKPKPKIVYNYTITKVMPERLMTYNPMTHQLYGLRTFYGKTLKNATTMLVQGPPFHDVLTFEPICWIPTLNCQQGPMLSNPETGEMYFWVNQHPKPWRWHLVTMGVNPLRIKSSVKFDKQGSIPAIQVWQLPQGA
eukprot:TRINITY_DN8940_c0_g1_i1.p1 TRINITY_DN8940_c0_g1~~TRINITY_DN8940_c0_g1_i1.p1  ORF type:complete len:349 (-),score=27.16 TRINITY_DN8940_c0_g1_i1:10-1056(-)